MAALPTIASCRGAQASQTPPKARRPGMFARDTEQLANELSIAASLHTHFSTREGVRYVGSPHFLTENEEARGLPYRGFLPLDLL